MSKKKKPEEHEDTQGKEDIRRAMRGLYEDIFTQTNELFGMDDGGIPGLMREIPNPEYEENGNGNGNGDIPQYVPAPSFYQMEGIQMIEREKRVLIADEMGAGKTLQAVGGVIHAENMTGRRLRTAVVAPNSMMDEWEERIRLYCNEDRVGKIVKVKDYSDETLEEIRNADWVLLNYEALSFSQETNRKNLIKEILSENGDNGEESRFPFFVLDESQNAKNPGSTAYRSKHVKDLADKAEYVVLLSGTPIPNTLKDTYMLISLLMPPVYEEEEEKDKKGEVKRDGDGNPIKKKKLIRGYPTPRHVSQAHRKDPAVIRSILRSKRLRRTEVYPLPPITDERVEVTLSKEEDMIYQSILDNYELEGAYKLQQLRKALVDTALVSPEVIDENLRPLLGTIEPAKYKELDKIVEMHMKRGEKVIIYSPEFREGVVLNLEERYKRYGSLRMDGTNTKNREANRKKFQKSPDHNVMVATNVAGEGINMNRANGIVFLHDPYAPGRRKQAIKRVHRRGQKNPVTVHTLHVPGTMDEGVMEFLEQKQEAIDFIEKGLKLSDEQMELMKQTISENVTPIRRRMYTPEQRAHMYVHRMSCQLAGKPENQIRKWASSKMAKRYADNYCSFWEMSYQANIARMYKEIVDGLEMFGNLDRKLDMASAFGVLSHVTGKKTTNVDINGEHFKTGMANEENENICSSMLDMNMLDDGAFDLAVCSLALHDTENRYNKKREGHTDRAKTLLEANRVLRTGGYFLVTLPRGYVPDGTGLPEGMEQFGFKAIPELTGFIRSLDPDDIGLHGYVMVCQKTGKPSETINESQIYLKVDDPVDPKKKTKRPSYSQRKRGMVHTFRYQDPVTGQSESLQDRLSTYMDRRLGE